MQSVLIGYHLSSSEHKTGIFAWALPPFMYPFLPSYTNVICYKITLDSSSLFGPDSPHHYTDIMPVQLHGI